MISKTYRALACACAILPPVIEVKPKRAFAVDSSVPPFFWRVFFAVGWRKPNPDPAALNPSEF